MLTMDDLLKEAVEKNASDLHIVVGQPPIFRINGNLVRTEYDILLRQGTEDLSLSIINDKQKQVLEEIGEIDFPYSLDGVSRFRINAFKQRGTMTMAIRIVPRKLPTLDELGHPEILKTLAQKNRGLVLVTGPSGSGKSTTLAAMIEMLNSEKSLNIITLEDPIEHLHSHKKSIVIQREIGADSKAFANALRSALRQDPDVILVGEMRDTETISTAITAADTGHLVLGTMHTGDATQTIDRIIDVFDPSHQQQIRSQLATMLQGVIAQQLLPRIDQPGSIVALEILVATPAVRNLIRQGNTHQIPDEIQKSSKHGMQSMNTSLYDLYRKGIVSYEDALSKANDHDAFIKLVGR